MPSVRIDRGETPSPDRRPQPAVKDEGALLQLPLARDRASDGKRPDGREERPSPPKEAPVEPLDGFDDLAETQDEREKLALPPLPAVKKKRNYGLILSFILCVVLPTAIVGAYSWFWAANQYEAEFRFAVTEVKPVLSGSPPSAAAVSGTSGVSAGGLSALLTGYSVTNGGMQNFVIIDYLKSRLVVDELESRLGIAERYGSSRAGDDWWHRFNSRHSVERLVKYWNTMMDASYDTVTGLAVVRVRAFSPGDAQIIAETLVTLSEDLINRIARRPQLDAIRFTEEELKKAEARMKEVRRALTEFRAREGVIDPVGSISGNTELVKLLRSQIVQLQTELAALGNQQQMRNSPTAQVLQSRIAAAKEQLAKVESEVSQSPEGNRILIEVVSRYEQLDMERQYAQAMLVSAMQALDQAKGNASAQHLYLTPYVRPALPQDPIYPRRTRQTALYAGGFLFAWVIGLMLFRSIREQITR